MVIPLGSRGVKNGRKWASGGSWSGFSGYFGSQTGVWGVKWGPRRPIWAWRPIYAMHGTNFGKMPKPEKKYNVDFT